MLSADTAFAFFGLSLLLSYAPGPDNVFVMLQAATHGARAGAWVVLGLCTGLVVHTLAVAFGLAAVLSTSSWAFTVIKSLGAGYLLFLAWKTWQASREMCSFEDTATTTSAPQTLTTQPLDATIKQDGQTARNQVAGGKPVALPQALPLYLRGVVMNVTNPKVLLFFMALLPQFVQPERGAVPEQILCLGAVFMLATLLAFGSLAWAAAYYSSRFLRSPKAQQWLHRLSVVVFVGLALQLVRTSF